VNTAGRNLHTIYTRSPSFLRTRAREPTDGNDLGSPRPGLMVRDVERRLVKRRLPELIVTGFARHPEVTPLGSLPCRCAETGLPADPCPTWPQRVTERTVTRLVVEHRYGHKVIMAYSIRAGKVP
jgi:hypothetical protein